VPSTSPDHTRLHERLSNEQQATGFVFTRAGFNRLEADADTFENADLDQPTDLIDARRCPLRCELQMAAQGFALDAQARPFT
jgi:hypothetical protein